MRPGARVVIRRKQPPLLYSDAPVSPMPGRRGLFSWHWQIRDASTGPVLAEGAARTRRGAMRQRKKARARCVRRRYVVNIEHPPLHPLTYEEAEAIQHDLREEGIRITLRFDPREVLVCPLADLSTWQKAAALHAVLRCTDVPVHWGRAVAR
jgi:hypothetical protein